MLQEEQVKKLQQKISAMLQNWLSEILSLPLIQEPFLMKCFLIDGMNFVLRQSKHFNSVKSDVLI